MGQKGGRMQTSKEQFELGCVFVILIATIWMVCSFAQSDKKITGYYLQRESGLTCVYNNYDWYPDAVAACFTSANDAVEAMKRLREGK